MPRSPHRVLAHITHTLVSRFVCRSELFEFDLSVDINIDVYPLKVRRAPPPRRAFCRRSARRRCFFLARALLLEQ